MATVYSPTAVELGDITIIDDGDPKDASGITAPMTAIADGVAYNGSQITANKPGRFLAATLLTSTSSATFTTGASTNKIRIRGVGGGGGGGGCTNVASASGAGGGGAAGSYAEHWFNVSPSTGYSYQCGQGGTGGTAVDGVIGANSTFTVGGTTVTAKGGLGGPVGVSSLTVNVTAGAIGQVSTNALINGRGAPGGTGVVILVASAIGAGGDGGSTVFGAGGKGATAAGGGGGAAVGYGGGGGGALVGGSASGTGGAATNGMWIVEEYS